MSLSGDKKVRIGIRWYESNNQNFTRTYKPLANFASIERLDHCCETSFQGRCMSCRLGLLGIGHWPGMLPVRLQRSYLGIYVSVNRQSAVHAGVFTSNEIDMSLAKRFLSPWPQLWAGDVVLLSWDLRSTEVVLLRYFFVCQSHFEHGSHDFQR